MPNGRKNGGKTNGNGSVSTRSDVGLSVPRLFTTPDVHPYDEIEWERRNSQIVSYTGKVSFEQEGVEFPADWSLNATNIVAEKYFRGKLNTPAREWSVRQIIDRVVDSIVAWGEEQGRFTTVEDKDSFEAELKHILVTQKASFNSPVWFNIGVPTRAQQASACQPYHSLVSTPEGLRPIGELVENNAIGQKVFDASGLTQVVAVKANGKKEVLRVTTKAGYVLDVTADHLVWRDDSASSRGFVEAGALRPGDQLKWHRVESWGDGEIDGRDIAEAALAGWLQSDGFVGQYKGTNKSLTIEAMTVTQAERDFVMAAIEYVFPGVHRHTREVETQDESLDCQRVRLYGNVLTDFVEKWNLRTRGVEMEVPEQLFTAPLPVVGAFLQAIFQAEGSVSVRERASVIAVDMISEKLIRGIQSLLTRFGIFSRVRFKADSRPDRKGCWSLTIRTAGDRRIFADEIGFIDPRKADKLEASFEIPGLAARDTKRLEIERIESLGEMDVYDIQTESGEYLSSGGLRVHNCFILHVEDRMDSIADWYRDEMFIFKGGSGSGLNVSNLRSSYEQLGIGGYSSGPVSFMRGADAAAGTIKSGGATRRAAKMVVFNIDHPDIIQLRDGSPGFIWCKAVEENKARALKQAGFDMAVDSGVDAYSIQYQNANNSIRVTDEYMQAYLEGRDWQTRAVTTGDVINTYEAREVMKQIAQAAWECADPGMQYHSTVNDWHTAPAAGPITASNPCFAGDTLVHTDKGLIRIDELVQRAAHGETFGVYTHDATNPDAPAERVELTSPEAYMVTGTNELLRIELSNGIEFKCTPNHRFWTLNRGWVEAKELSADDRVKLLNVPTPAVSADWILPVSSQRADYLGKGDRKHLEFELPEKWDEELAYYMGWLVGDGCISGNVVTTVYAGEEKTEALERHMRLVTRLNGGRSPKPAQLANGTLQLRLSRRPLARFFRELGISETRAHEKAVPWSIFQAPTEIVTSFLRGLFDADGCVVEGGTNYVGYSSTSLELSKGVQQLLATFGIQSRRYSYARKSNSFSYTRKDGTEVEYTSRTSYDLRITSDSFRTFVGQIGFDLSRKMLKALGMLGDHEFYASKGYSKVRAKEFAGFDTTYNLSEPRNHSYLIHGVIARNCSEYMHLDNSPCNLASLNLLKFLRDDSTFDTQAFEHTVFTVLLGQAILCVAADYPTEKIGENARGFRQLGIGYANLGALLMALGVPYDSDEGRSWAGAITSLMQGAAYRASARFAEIVGPYPGTDELPGFAHPENRGATLRVLKKHAAFSKVIAQRPTAEDRKLDRRVDVYRDEVVGTGAPVAKDAELARVVARANEVWDDTLELAEKFGVENSQVSVLAPTGTIGFMMDCDTTGVEPDLALKKVKKMVGGGTMSIVNQTLPRALRRLGYNEEQVEAIVAFVDENNTVVGAPALKPEHYDVFACSFTTDNLIGHMGHLKMMAAVQPFLSGAISKCVTGDTLLTTADGLVRIASLHDGEGPDTFRPAIYEVASLDGTKKTDAFYYGGVRPVMDATLRSGHGVTGTANHRLLVADDGKLEWRRIDEIRRGEYVAVQYGTDLWSVLPPLFLDFQPSARHCNQKTVAIPTEMTSDLAFLLGAYASEGHTTRANWTISITNSVDEVLEKVASAWRTVFGVEPRVDRPKDRCPSVVVSSKTIVEFFEYLGCGRRASGKRIPDAILRSPRDMVLSFMQGLFLDAYTTTSGGGKFGICVDSPPLLDDLQAVLTNLGIVHGRITKWNPDLRKEFEEVYVCGEQAKRLLELVPFLEPEKVARATAILGRDFGQSTADIVPGLKPRDLFEMMPAGKGGLSSTGGGRSKFAFLCDARTKHVSRGTLERVAAHPGVSLPTWLQTILDDGLHFSPVEDIGGCGERDVYDLSVPGTHAFVGNGIVNHNTVNVPESATVEQMEEIFVEGWRLGLKAVAMYRDNCKADQPLSADQKKVVEDTVGETPAVSARRRMPRVRDSKTYSFRVADTEGYVHVGLYPDTGQPGEMFIKVAKQGSTLAGVMGAFALSVSMGLQHGVPLETYVEKFVNDTFEPHGITDDPDIRFAKSLMDYIFRRLALDFLPENKRLALGIRSVQERTEMAENGGGGNGMNLIEQKVQKPSAPAHLASTADLVPALDAPLCSNCGTRMRPAGSCFACESCGSTSGCS